MIKLNVRAVARPLNTVFSIARGQKSEAATLVVELESGEHKGRGEAVPYGRYGETMKSEIAKLQSLAPIELEMDVRDYLETGAARNALDCAIWDLKAKIAGQPVSKLLDIDAPNSVQTAQTVTLTTPKAMAEQASKLGADALIKIKLGGEGDLERLRAIRQARPGARLSVDANEGWSVADYQALIPALVELGVEMIEQPFSAVDDLALAEFERPIPICADESVHVASEIEELTNRYDMINIKLDKSGGLVEALDMINKANAFGLPYMIGCMVGSSLSMAPAFLLTKHAAYADLDGPLFLQDDEKPAIEYCGGVMFAPLPELWG